MMTATLAKISLAPAVSSTAVSDGTALLDERRGMIYHLNHTGAAALSALLDGGYEAAVIALCARYTITAGVARRDLTRLLAELLAHRLVITL